MPPARKRMINTTCHGCKQAMSFEAVPVTLRDIDGTSKTHYGKDWAVWICKTCRQEPSKLKAARIAAGMPATPTTPSEFDDEQEVA